MNTPTQITLSNPLVINSSTNSPGNELTQLPNETLAAKNIHFSKDSITLDVFINKHWQTLRLGTTNSPPNVDKIANANIQLSADGKQLAITPNHTTLTLNQPAQLQRLLNFISAGTEIQSEPIPVQVLLKPSPKLYIESLNVSLAINKDIAKLLSTEQPLKLIMTTHSQGAKLNVINRYADTVHTQSLSQAKLAKLLANLLPSAQLQATPKLAVLTHPQKSGSFTIPISNKHLTELPSYPVKVNLAHQLDKIIIKTAASNITVSLSNSFSKPFNELLIEQASNLSKAAFESTAPAKINPLMNSASPIKSWLQSSFSDLKTRIHDAVKYFETKSFTSSSNVEFTQSINSQKKGAALALTTQALNKINLLDNANIKPANSSKPIANTTNILAKHFAQLPPLVQLTQALKASVTLWQSPPAGLNTLLSSNQTPQKGLQEIKPQAQFVDKSIALTKDEKTSINTALQKNNNSLRTQLLDTMVLGSRSQMLQPIEAKVLTSLLNLPTQVIKDETMREQTPLSSQLAKIPLKVSKQAPQLSALVNQAFSRMVSSTNINPITVQREILATLQPDKLPDDILQSSFTKGLEQLTASILAAPAINQSTTPIIFNNRSGIDALLHVLMPTFKVGNNSKAIVEQLQQPQIQTLAGELSQAKNTLGQVNISTPNQQPETNPLAQFLLPMKLPPEAAQTEITLGQYKKPSTDKLEPKNVWFVRLNFDYAQLGKLQVTAELMDKALDCQLLASSQEVSALAHPHLDNLRSKLAKHGLQVGELNLKRGEASHEAFYKSHAIINIKV